jgi:hypothetical protein
MERLYAVPAHECGLPRTVVLLTDGHVGNTREVIAAAAEQRAASGLSIYTLGIGSGVSTELVQGLAAAGGGQAVFLDGGEAMEPYVVSQMRAALGMDTVTAQVAWRLPAMATLLPSLATRCSVTPVNTGHLFAVWSPDVAAEGGGCYGGFGRRRR